MGFKLVLPRYLPPAIRANAAPQISIMDGKAFDVGFNFQATGLDPRIGGLLVTESRHAAAEWDPEPVTVKGHTVTVSKFPQGPLDASWRNNGIVLEVAMFSDDPTRNSDFLRDELIKIVSSMID